jgi:hypothetical protein
MDEPIVQFNWHDLMQEHIDNLLSILERHAAEKRYACTIDLLWFLCRLFEGSVAQVSANQVDRLCQIATCVLPVIDRQVQYADIDIEFRNGVYQLGKAIFLLRGCLEIQINNLSKRFSIVFVMAIKCIASLVSHRYSYSLLKRR